MSDIVIYIILIVVFLAVGIFLGMYIGNLKTKAQQEGLQERNRQLQSQFDDLKLQIHAENEKQNESFQQQLQAYKESLDKTEQEREDIRREKDNLNIELARKNSEFESLHEKFRERDETIKVQQEQLRKDFELLANKILEEKSTKFTEQNKENIKNILTPLQEKIQHFEKKVEDSQKENISIHSALREKLSELSKANLQISQEAVNLTKALKGDSKMQGNWGELVLERVLEKSGLEKDREYVVQQNFTLADGSRVLPDVIINLPNNKKMVIDSKVSLTAYERFVNSEDEEKESNLKEHLTSIKRHVDQLSDKKYEDLYEIESPDFVLMFIPIEPAFAIAVNEDSTLYSKAFEKNIVIVTPTTLLATLRTIDTMWNNEKQQQNAIEIARQAGALYDKFEGFMSDLIGIGKKIDATKSDYSAAMNKLFEGRGNIIKSIEKIKKMGAKAKKSLPESILKRAETELETDDMEGNEEPKKLF
ncbi:DNA recombination protein RmuC [Kordia periserrulae]|uniref:DNA recombination protein RmuC n=1 Tax=Kordia periserrulae TaxID=701523 RepID=A0A2T6C220_9FLAO|nr:DNA recombination protein RmuC [Kordia periserrulae]PTX62359.1 DNA recombination protein RmuC [Kordia periserrulae]